MLGVKSEPQFIHNTMAGIEEKKACLSKGNLSSFYISNKSFEESCSLHALLNPITTKTS